MTAPTAEIRERLERHPWHLTLTRLRRYAKDRAARLTWSGFRRGPLPGGRQSEDVVGTAIEKVLTGVREWDPAQHPDLDLFLESVVDSEISHLVEGWDHRHIRPVAALPRDPDREEEEDAVAAAPSAAPGPAEGLLQREREREGDDFYRSFHATLTDDSVLQRIVECIEADVVKPGEIAERLGIPVTEIYNRRKQLQRRLTDFYQGWNAKRSPADRGTGRRTWPRAG